MNAYLKIMCVTGLAFGVATATIIIPDTQIFSRIFTSIVLGGAFFGVTMAFASLYWGRRKHR